MKERNKFLLVFSQAILGVGIFFLYITYIRYVFEKRTNFENLTNLEKDSLLRKEDALYFSFYKIIIESNDFWEGYDKLKNNTLIEYPNSVNVIQRFHVLPEIVIGYLYHSFKQASFKLGIPILSCWRLDNDVDVICDGMGEHFHFYLEFVWILGGFTVFILYVYSIFLSDNIFGGISSVLLYMIFHKFASKIYERPVARENFAFPFILWQMLYLSICILRMKGENKIRFKVILKLTILTTISLLSWQFSSVIFATQTLIMIIPWSLKISTGCLSIEYAISQLLATLLTYYFSYQNKKHFITWQNGPAFALLFLNIGKIIKLFKSNQSSRSAKNSIINSSNESLLKNLSFGLLIAISSQETLTDFLEKIGWIKSEDNPYKIYKDLIFYWSLQRKTNFSTNLLACNPEFSEFALEDFWELIKTLFIKPYCLYGIVLLAKFFRKWRYKSMRDIKQETIERAKNYLFEDFIEENNMTMKEIQTTFTNKNSETEFNSCLKLLEECNYDYDEYKKQKADLKRIFSFLNEHYKNDNFMNNVKLLKEQINEKRKERKNSEEKLSSPKDDKEKSNNNLNEKLKNNEPSKRAIKKKNLINKNYFNNINYHQIYAIIQLLVFCLIGLMIKKLFFLCYTLGCVLAPALCSKFWNKKQNNIFWTISLVVFLTSIIDPGISNFQKEFISEPKSDNLESMLQWINLNTERDAVFGGPIEVIATIHLNTRRPIVNHPHLEMKQINERTEAVYSVFSRQQSSDIYNQCSQNKIQYLVISFNDCLNSSTNNECDVLYIWDEIQPAYRKYPQFCAELANKNIPSFLKLYANKYYGIIKMFSHSVQLNLKNNKMIEKFI